MSIPEIGQRLGVQYVLESGVRRSGNRLRVSARLIETEKGRQIWAQRCDRQLGDIFRCLKMGYAYYHCEKFKEAREAAEVSIKTGPTNLQP
jgi:hypothetical protein